MKNGNKHSNLNKQGALDRQNGQDPPENALDGDIRKSIVINLNSSGHPSRSGDKFFAENVANEAGDLQYD